MAAGASGHHPSEGAIGAAEADVLTAAGTQAVLGEAIRQRRRARGMRQGDLAEAAGLSVSFISQFERGRTDASINSLTRICAALGITLGALFQDGPRAVEVLKAEDVKVIDLEGATKRVYTSAELPGVDVYTVDLPPGGSSGAKAYTHDGQRELIICRSGFVAVEIDERQYLLRARDSIVFPSETMHRVENIGTADAEITWVVRDL
ncbi:cupin domain-containing protein [Sediminivirga luteola]|uniref:Transcriptional regulator n=1 Tax=Sediminivirga luteola TaxID=1774748 RepID=A0A8J2TWL3_9MICO|nr:cupin domain-containing protein [Sediminivirga luteola]MCI2266205.1 cupin domain-containing protein [Sediminivirga luteola]GGA08289.1 transcriptional regulator [Sediminivirga luteola]